MTDLELTPEWINTLATAQQDRFTERHGRAFERLAHAGGMRCRDCAAAPGQLHVPGCCIERCPACHRQAIACDCPIDPEVH